MSSAAAATAAPQIYGADEINAIVLDPGSYQTKIGFAGQDCPSLVMPSYYGEVKDGSETKRILSEDMLYYPRENLEIKPILKNNIIQDWDGAIAQYDYMINALSIEPSEQPILFTESTMNSYENKVKALEYFLEEKEFGAIFMVKQPTCVSFAHGRPNCLVVDIGHDLITVTPIIDGIALKNTVVGTTYSGAFLNQQLLQFLSNKEIELNNLYEVKSKKPVYWDDLSSQPQFERKKFSYSISDSFKSFQSLRVWQEMKETLIVCGSSSSNNDGVGEKAVSEDAMDGDDTLYFELPNGLNVPFTKSERYKIGNSLFNPTKLLNEEVVKGWEEPQDGKIIKYIGNGEDKTSKEYAPLRRTMKKNDEDDNAEKENGDDDDSKKTKEKGKEKEKENGDNSSGKNNDTEETNGAASVSMNNPVGLSMLIQSVLENLDIDLKPQLANNIIVTGSTSLIPGLNEKLNSELSLLNPSLKIRIHCVNNMIERKYSSWIGGSILSSLGTFHQLWVSKAEYLEEGAEKLIVSRFR